MHGCITLWVTMAMQQERIKWVEGTPFMVDGFRFLNPRCRHYLLTHFHSGKRDPYFPPLPLN